MTLVTDKVRELTNQIDRIAATSFVASFATEHAESTIPHLQSLIQHLELGNARKLPSLDHISKTLRAAEPPVASTDATAETTPTQDEELQWLLLARCAIVVYGTFLDRLFDQTLPISRDLLYWDRVLSSRLWTSLYVVQTTPERVYTLGKAVWDEAVEQGHLVMAQSQGQSQLAFFTSAFRGALGDRAMFRKFAFPTLPKATDSVLSLGTLLRGEMRARRRKLRSVREVQAAGLGLLVTESLDLGDEAEWKQRLVTGIDLIEDVLQRLSSADMPEVEAEAVFPGTPERSLSPANTTPEDLRLRLLRMCDTLLPTQASHSISQTSLYGRPSALTRYWPLALTTALFGPSVLRILLSRRQAFDVWVKDMYTTTIDFWHNWVLQPLEKIVGTIRHSEESEVALMSKRSLGADMESLERMVVDFVVDGQHLSGSELELVRTQVKQGDVTPVLRAYENDIRSPLKNAVMGTLVRSLLIQIQKTKVDVEVAISGIDRLLKSQELVFGFVGVTPSLAVCYVVARWVSGIFSRRSRLAQSTQQGDIRKTLRNVDRILTLAKAHDKLPYKDQGLLLCEVHLLREYAKRLPEDIKAEFLEDLSDLEGRKLGVKRQRRTIDRMWKCYDKWL
ncbi:Nuclear control of ATPase protein 2 [Saitoella coloradoensis]